MPRRIQGVVSVALGVVLVAISGFAVWVEVFGSRLTGYRLAELIGDFGSEMERVPPAWVGAVWYLLPFSAGVCWLLLFRRMPPSASTTHTWMGMAVAMAAGLFAGFQEFQPGPSLALAGGVLICAGGMVGQPRRADITAGFDRSSEEGTRQQHDNGGDIPF